MLQADPREFPIKASRTNAVDDQAEHMLACKHVGKKSVHHAILMKTGMHAITMLKNTSNSVALEVNVKQYLKPGQAVDKPRTDLTVHDYITGQITHLDFMFVTTKPNTNEEKSSVSLGEATKDKHNGDLYTFPVTSR